MGSVDFTGTNPQDIFSPTFVITVIDECYCNDSVLQKPAAPMILAGHISINIDNVALSTVADGFTDSVGENALCTLSPPCTAPTYTLVYHADNKPVPASLATLSVDPATGKIRVTAQT